MIFPHEKSSEDHHLWLFEVDKMFFALSCSVMAKLAVTDLIDINMIDSHLPNLAFISPACFMGSWPEGYVK